MILNKSSASFTKNSKSVYYNPNQFKNLTIASMKKPINFNFIGILMSILKPSNIYQSIPAYLALIPLVKIKTNRS